MKEQQRVTERKKTNRAIVTRRESERVKKASSNFLKRRREK